MADQFYNTRCVKPLEQPSFNTITYGCNSFTNQSAKEWNLFGRVLKEALSVEDSSAIHVFYKECKSGIYVFS